MKKSLHLQYQWLQPKEWYKNKIRRNKPLYNGHIRIYHFSKVAAWEAKRWWLLWAVFLFDISMARLKAIRRSFIYQLYKNQDLRKAFALALYIKLNFVSSDVSHYSLNKLHKLTGLHYQTLKKRLETLRKYNLIKFNGDSLVFCKVSSKSDSIEGS